MPSFDPGSISENLSQAANFMQGSSSKDDDEKKKDEKDPMLSFADQLVDFAMEMSGCSDTDFDPMSIVQKGKDFFSKFDSDTEGYNKASSPDSGKDLVNSEELETAVTLAL